MIIPKREKMIKKVFQYAVGIALCGSFLFSCKSGNKENELTLADASVVWWMAPGSIAQKDSIYEKNGLKVKTFSLQTGLESKNAVISGAADIGLTATTPLAMGGFNRENLIVLCSYMESNSLLSVLTTQNDTALFPKPEPPIAIVRGTISELYFYNYIKTYYPDINVSTLNQVIVKPADATNAVKGGSANSVVIWEPFATMLFEQMTDLKVCRAENVYTHRMYIVTTPEILKKKRVAIQKFIKSFEQACELLNTNPAKGKAILKSIFPQQESSMNALWEKVDFSLKFDYETMKDLIIKDARISSDLGQTPGDKSGNPRQLNREDIQHYFDFKLN
jgi:ABC-type nitrate/sulfonate/bicarbonate transport system substrate-binding protein